MRLVEEPRPNREYQPYIVPELDADELAGDEEPPTADASAPEEAEVVIDVIAPPEEHVPPTGEPPPFADEAELESTLPEAEVQETGFRDPRLGRRSRGGSSPGKQNGGDLAQRPIPPPAFSQGFPPPRFSR